MTFKDYLIELKKYTPYDFSDYSDNSIYRRIHKIQTDSRLTLEQITELTRTNPIFVEKLVEEITVNTTELFRDPEVWENLFSSLYPSLGRNKTITVWHAGCSSGQEVYSNLILLNELGLLERSRVIATDISQKMLSNAKAGIYPLTFNRNYIDNFNKVLNKNGHKVDFSKYFDVDEANDLLQVKSPILNKAQFIRHNLVNGNPPFAYKVDLLFCRNVLIYFNSALQTKVVQSFHDQMYKGAALVLGNHEALPGYFKAKFSKSGTVYQKSGSFHFSTEGLCL
jgi:chemotaxis protein methyltransferase CheR